MSVSPELVELTREEVLPAKQVRHPYLEKIMANLNALYEGLFGYEVPGNPVQIFSGHDHCSEGGGPLLRSNVLTVDQFSIPIWVGTFNLMGQVQTPVLGPRWVSPGLIDLESVTSVRICIAVVGGSVDVWAGQDPTNKVRVDSTVEDGVTTQKWIALQSTVLRSGQFANTTISVTPAEFQEETITCSILCFSEVEDYSSMPLRGVRDLPDVGVPDNDTYSYFGPDLKLDPALVDYSSSLNSFVLRELFFALNALFEATVNRAAPGALTQTNRGHDHKPFAEGGAGGRPTPKGLIFSAGGTQENAWFKSSCPTPDQWEYADNNPPAANLRRTDPGTPGQIGGAGSTIHQFEAYVSHGFDSSQLVPAPPTSHPYLVAWVYVTSDVGFGDASVRIFNQTTGTLSEEVDITQEEWNLIRFIPCQGGAWNKFDIQVKRPVATTPNIYVTGFRLFEVPEVDGVFATYKDSGKKQLGVPRELQKVAESHQTTVPPVVVP